MTSASIGRGAVPVPLLRLKSQLCTFRYLDFNAGKALLMTTRTADGRTKRRHRNAERLYDAACELLATTSFDERSSASSTTKPGCCASSTAAWR
jgi:hypothetical protein